MTAGASPSPPAKSTPACTSSSGTPRPLRRRPGWAPTATMPPGITSRPQWQPPRDRGALLRPAEPRAGALARDRGRRHDRRGRRRALRTHPHRSGAGATQSGHAPAVSATICSATVGRAARGGSCPIAEMPRNEEVGMARDRDPAADVHERIVQAVDHERRQGQPEQTAGGPPGWQRRSAAGATPRGCAHGPILAPPTRASAPRPAGSPEPDATEDLNRRLDGLVARRRTRRMQQARLRAPNAE